MAGSHRNGNDKSRKRLGIAPLSESMRTKRLSLPAVHNRDTTRLVELVTKDTLSADELRSYCSDKRSGFVMAVIQSAARRLGEYWSQDRTSFSTLSVGLSRLHDLLAIATEERLPADDGPSYAVLLQPFDDHVLTGALLEARLRNAGYATQFFPSWSGESLEDFDGVFICASNSDRQAETERLIDDVRKAGAATAPIVVGGRAARSTSDLPGADLVTSSLLAAVTFCEGAAAQGRT